MHHLKVEVVCRALQDERGAHVGCGVMEVKDNIIGIWTSFRSKYLIDFLGSLNFIWQLVSTWHAVERSWRAVLNLTGKCSLGFGIKHKGA